jgi:very-short-patch-repair endonuclease
VSDAEDNLAAEMRWLKMPAPKRQHRFHGTRKWLADFAWPEHMVMVEVDGGGFVQGRHSRGVGMANDAAKQNEAVLLGWRVLRVTPAQITSGEAIDWIQRALSEKVIAIIKPRRVRP